jgi:N-acetylglucosamine-6-phosphate deacetylase
MGALQIYTASKIFTGEKWLQQHAIIVEQNKIKEITDTSSLSTHGERIDFENLFIVPAFIDLQLYGAYDKLLAVYPEPATLQKINEYCRKGGAAFCLPTVATNQEDTYRRCIDAVRDYWFHQGKGVLGLHIEGPWINPRKKGAHAEEYIHPPTIDEVYTLLEHGKDVIKMITLAPEVCSNEVVRLIRSYGIVISAGHSNATYDEATRSFENGITCCTHLYNAMSPLQHREPGLAGAILDHDKVMASIIPDGYHVDWAAIRIAKKIMNNRLFAITDSVTETTVGLYQHHLEGDRYTADGILSGSALDMAKGLRNLVNHVGINLDEALRMCSTYPAKVFEIENDIGRIEQGYNAAFTVLNEALEVMEVISN